MSVNVYYLSGIVVPFPNSFGNGISGNFFIGDTTSGLWSFSTNNTTVLTGIPASNYKNGKFSYVYENSGNVWISNNGYGLLNFINSNSSFTEYPIITPLLNATVSTASGGYGFSTNGSVYYQNGTLLTGGSIGLPFWGGNPQSEGINYYGYNGPSGFSEITFNSTLGITTGIIGLPSGVFQSTCVSYVPSISAVILGAQSPAIFSSGSIALSVNISNPGVLLSISPSISGGTISAWGAPRGTGPSGQWSYVSSLSGIGFGSNNFIDFYSTSGAVAIDSTSGVFRAFSYAGGTITETQTASVSGVYNYITVYDSNLSLIPQTSTSSVIQYGLSGNTWVPSGTAITGILEPTIVSINGTSAGIGFASGLSIISYNNGWSPVSSVSLPFQPTSISLDSSGNYFCAGQGSLALISSSGLLLSSGSFLGTNVINGTAFYKNQYYALTSATIEIFAYQTWDSLFNHKNSFVLNNSQFLSYNGTVWSQVSASLTPINLVYYENLFLVPSTIGIVELLMNQPFSVDYIYAGASVLYSGASYLSVSGLGYGNIPCQVGIDYNNVTRMFTTNGNMLLLTSGNTVSSVTNIWSGGGGFLSIVSSATSIWTMPALNPSVLEIT